MTNFDEYMEAKRIAAQSRMIRVTSGEFGPRVVATRTVVETESDQSGRIGIRRTFIRNHEVITDSGPDLGGFNAGPSPVELLLTALGGCLAHTFMLQAAARRVTFSRLEVDASARSDPRGGNPAFPEISVAPSDFRFVLKVESNATAGQLQTAFEAAERLCPVTALLVGPTPVTGTLEIGFDS